MSSCKMFFVYWVSFQLLDIFNYYKKWADEAFLAYALMICDHGMLAQFGSNFTQLVFPRNLMLQHQIAIVQADEFRVKSDCQILGDGVTFA